MDTLFRIFVLKECHGWEHETALIEYLECSPALRDRLDLETIPVWCEEPIPGVEESPTNEYRLECIEFGETAEYALSPVRI